MILASDLAPMFGVTAKQLNQQIRRNEGRFPQDFGFRLTRQETARLRLQIEASNPGRGGYRHPPFVVTEYGVVMLANVIDSERAISMSVRVVREFVRLRAIARSGCPLKEKFHELERVVRSRLDAHETHIGELFAAVQRLLDGPGDVPERRQIGFTPETDP